MAQEVEETPVLHAQDLWGEEDGDLHGEASVAGVTGPVAGDLPHPVTAQGPTGTSETQETSAIGVGIASMAN